MADQPAYFGDLNLDQIFESVTTGREEYDLKPLFYSPLHEPDEVRFRQEVLRDLENDELSSCIESFAQQMRRVRGLLASMRKLQDRYYREGWFLDAAELYCDAVNSLAEGLTQLEVRSRGLTALREYLGAYIDSDKFTSLATETRQRRDDLGGIRYCVLIRGNRFTVSNYAEDPDYSVEVQDTFTKFKQGGVKDYRVTFPDLDMNHIQSRVLELVARLNPAVFSALDEYCARHPDFIDATLQTFEKEVQFYLGYLEYIEPFKQSGLPFCYPEVSDHSKELVALEAFDLALANEMVQRDSTLVCNDLRLKGPERLLIVTGPNQGGKTTFARMFGQLHHLAGLGLSAPARRAQLLLPDRIFTHFEKQESLASLRGKLEDELVRVHEILEQATEHSIVIMNETFTSTTLQDAVLLGTEVVKEMIMLDFLGVYVTFVDELAALSDATVSMVATVDPDDPARRTFKIRRKLADGLAYAAALAEQYGLTYEVLKRRLAP